MHKKIVQINLPWAGFELGSLGLQGLSLCATNWTTLTSCNQIEWTKENSAKLYQCRKGPEIVFFASASKLMWNLKNLKHRVTSKAILSQEVRKENLTLNHAKVTQIFWTFFMVPLLLMGRWISSYLLSSRLICGVTNPEALPGPLESPSVMVDRLKNPAMLLVQKGLK